MSIASVLHESFVKPLCNGRLAGLYAATVLGLAGQALVMIYLAYDLAGLGIKTLLFYFVLSPAIANLLLMPFGFYLFARLSAQAFLLLILVYMSVMFSGVFFLRGDEVIAIRALMANFMNPPFWLLYHSSVLHYSSHENRGNELALAHLGMALGVILGSLAAGFLLTSALPRGLVLCMATGTTVSATLVLFTFARRAGVVRDEADPQCQTMGRDIINTIKGSPQQAQATALEMVYETAVGSLWPVWLKIVGASGLVVGFLSAINVVLKFFLSPVVGRFVNSGGGHEVQKGPLFKLVGWLPWLAYAHPLTAIWSSSFFSIGGHFFKIGLESRWYGRKAFAAMAAREILIGTGRIIGALFFIPTLYYAPQFFVLLGIAVTTLVYFSGSQLRRAFVTAAE